MSQLTTLSESEVCPIFTENTLWAQGLQVQASFSYSDLQEALHCTSFAGISLHMQKIIKRSFLTGHLYFILGPITPKKDGPKIEEHLTHFLRAYYYHCRKEGRRVFPQFLYTPIISHLARLRVVNGESWDVVGPAILQEIYQPVFDCISRCHDSNKVSGYWLEGYKNSDGAMWELDIFKKYGWNYVLPDGRRGNLLTNEFYAEHTVHVFG